MPTNFLPTRDAALLEWSANFNAKINSSPGSWGLSSAQAAAYSALHSAFAAAYANAVTPDTRTRSAVLAKNTARAALRASARALARVVQATATVTPAQKIDLGLTAPLEVVSPILPPTEAPLMDVVFVAGRTIKLHLREAGSARRTKPKAVRGASVFSYLGANPPMDIGEWRFEGSVTRTSFSVEMPSSVAPGSQVWLTAFWFNPRMQRGPACTPICTYVAGGVAMAA